MADSFFIEVIRRSDSGSEKRIRVNYPYYADEIAAAGQSTDVQDAIDGANAPDAGNVFATMGDLVDTGGTFEAAENSPADGEDTVFTFASGTPVVVFRNGVNETRLGTIGSGDFTFDVAPDEDDDIEGLI